jgi:gas vesicle protein
MSQKNANVMGVAVVAGLAGAGIALLSAPRSGKETRAKMNAKAQDLKHKAEGQLQRGRDLTSRMAESFKQSKDEIQAQSKDSKDNLKSSIVEQWGEE